MTRNAEEEVHPFPSPSTATSMVRECKGTLLVSSIRAVRDAGHFDAYSARLGASVRDAILHAVAGTWLPIELAAAHYTACDALNLSTSEQHALGATVQRRLNASLLSTLATLARASGVTPWTVLAHYQQIFDLSFRGGGGTRIFKLGPKEARIEIVGMPLAQIAYFRNAYCGFTQVGGELFCRRLHIRELPSYRSATTLAARASWA